MGPDALAKPLISVIITSYNYLRYITTAIDSARAQTYANVEIVVVDNCSTDGTVPALRARYGDDPRVRIYENDRNIGELLNSNRGFELTTGEFVAWLSADDWMYPGHLQLLHEVFERAPHLDVAYSRAYFANETGAVYAERMPEQAFPYAYVDARDELVEMFTSTCPICWPTALFRRAVFDEVGLERPEDGIHATDWEFQIRIAVARKRFGYVATPTVAIRIHDRQATGGRYHLGGRRLTDFLLMIEKYLDHPELARLRGRERAMLGFFSWLVDDTVAASGKDVFAPEVYARIAAVKRTLTERAQAYEPARVHERRISVVLPVARSPVLAARALESLGRQTFGPWEAVVVDHGPLSLEAWIDAHPLRERIAYVRAPAPLAAASARNVALRMARGEYLAFLGEANVFAPEHLTTLAAAIARSGGRVAATASRLVLELYDPRFLAIERVGEAAIHRQAGDPADLSRIADALPLDALLVYRSVRDTSGGFGELPFLDELDFVMRLERDHGIAFAPQATVEIRAGLDLSPVAPTLGRYVAVLDAIYNANPAPSLAAARARHRAAVERAVAGLAADATMTAQRAAEILATLAGRAVQPIPA